VKRGGGVRPISLDDAGAVAAPMDAMDLVGLDAALTSLEAQDPQKARVVELRFFAGLTAEQTASALGISASTVARDWAFAKAWLHRELTREES
jgi:RNA polymerase sigma factor (TIGR02999 family)